MAFNLREGHDGQQRNGIKACVSDDEAVRRHSQRRASAGGLQPEAGPEVPPAS